MPYFPVFLDLTGKSCLVVGAGQVGKRKIQRILDCSPAELTVVDPLISEWLQSLEREFSCLRLVQREFYPTDLQDKDLVIASTSSAQLNKKISNLCQERKIFCNIVDKPELCSFILPAVHQQGELCLAVSTSGASPALSAKIKGKLKQEFGPEYALLIKLLAGLRPLILNLNLTQSQNREYFHKLQEDNLLNLIKQKDKTAIKRFLQDNLPQTLHQGAERLVHELF